MDDAQRNSLEDDGLSSALLYRIGKDEEEDFESTNFTQHIPRLSTRKRTKSK